MPELLRRLLARILIEVQRVTDELEQGALTVVEWKDSMQRILVRGHTAAMMAGLGRPTLPDRATDSLRQILLNQFKYLDGFVVTIADTEEWTKAFNARAAMYAAAIKEPYWRGQTKFLPLPAMPAQGTQCLSNCGCAWRIEVVDEEKGDYDAYWERAKNDSCQTCVQREADWSPVEIRGGVLQL